MKKENVKNKIIIILSITIILLIGTMSYLFFQKPKNIFIEGKVITEGIGYMIIETEENDYLYETEETYKEGSIVKIDIQKKDENSLPITIQEGTLELIEEPNNDAYVSGSIEIEEDPKPNTPNQNEIKHPSKEPETEKTDNYNETVIPEETKDKDQLVIAYLNELEPQIETKENESIIKNGFITITDFLFYNGDIKGVTLNEISTKTKLTILKFALKIDAKIDSYFPDYKEKISNTTSKIYTGVKNKIIETYLNTTAKICTQNETLCADAKKDFQSMKTSFKITWNIVKNLANSGLGNLKEWYEIYSGKK